MTNQEVPEIGHISFLVEQSRVCFNDKTTGSCLILMLSYVQKQSVYICSLLSIRFSCLKKKDFLFVKNANSRSKKNKAQKSQNGQNKYEALKFSLVFHTQCFWKTQTLYYHWVGTWNSYKMRSWFPVAKGMSDYLCCSLFN